MNKKKDFSIKNYIILNKWIISQIDSMDDDSINKLLCPQTMRGILEEVSTGDDEILIQKLALDWKENGVDYDDKDCPYRGDDDETIKKLTSFLSPDSKRELAKVHRKQLVNVNKLLESQNPIFLMIFKEKFKNMELSDDLLRLIEEEKKKEKGDTK